MRFLLRTLSLSYVSRHKLKMLLTVLGVVVGVATFTAIRSAKTALLNGLESTVDRIAGKAHLQISIDGGVPEELAEKLREVPGVAALAPVIEQIAVPARGELGSVLVLGVDLLGDREMREYGFTGEDADLDDPLLFLAQSDSVALARPLAERAGIAVGGVFALRGAEGEEKRLTVRGLLTPKGFAESFGGNLLVMDVYAAQVLFGRGRRFDRVDVRLEDGVPLEQGIRALRHALGEGYRVETPERRGAQMQQLVGTFVAGFDVSSVFALCIGTFLIFNAFTVSVNRRRKDIGTLRALGATPRQVRMLFLLEAAAVGIVGGGAGVLLGAALSQSFLSMMAETAETIYGLSDVSSAELTTPLVLQSMLLGIGASLAGAFLPSRDASRVSPTEALAKGSFTVRAPSFSIPRAAIGAALVALACAAAILRPIQGYPLVLSVLAVATFGGILLAGPLARLVFLAVRPALARSAPISGPLAADSLLSNPRRTSGTVTAAAVSLAFVLGTASYMSSIQATFDRWMQGILTSDLYVRASTNLVRPDYRFPAELKAELEAVPGVRAVESYRGVRFESRGDRVLLVTIEIGPMMDRTHREFLQGSEEEMRRGLTRERKVAVSDNYHRRFGVGVGDFVELPAPTGLSRLQIAAVVRDFSSDKGAILMDRSVFLELWAGDDRVDVYDVNLRKGTDETAVRDAIRKLLAGRMPALVSTRREFEAEISHAVDGFYVLTRITTLLAMVVAFLGIVTSLLISVVERTREIGILKSIGALGGQIRRSVVLEALAVAGVGLLLALPGGVLLSRFMETTVAETFAGWRLPHRLDLSMLGQLALLLPVVSALAAWLPARQAARTKVTEALEYE